MNIGTKGWVDGIFFHSVSSSKKIIYRIGRDESRKGCSILITVHGVARLARTMVWPWVNQLGWRRGICFMVFLGEWLLFFFVISLLQWIPKQRGKGVAHGKEWRETQLRPAHGKRNGLTFWVWSRHGKNVSARRSARQMDQFVRSGPARPGH